MPYDPFTGKELWRVEEGRATFRQHAPGARTRNDFLPDGILTGQLFAVRTGGTGLITDTHVAWKVKRSVSNKPSILLLIGDLIFMVSDNVIASCLEAKTGNLVWQQRLGGEARVPPRPYADGKIWLFSEEGKTTVLQPAPRISKARGKTNWPKASSPRPPSSAKHFTCARALTCIALRSDPEKEEGASL
ncbi:MAG: PQQ-binding-like beta-propeller repeat protein [Blastocatellia bacterium]